MTVVIHWMDRLCICDQFPRRFFEEMQLLVVGFFVWASYLHPTMTWMKLYPCEPSVMYVYGVALRVVEARSLLVWIACCRAGVT